MKITVTRKHIARGVPGDPSNCPLAIAINEQCPTHEARVYGMVGGIFLESLIDGSELRVPMTWEAMRFVVAFDGGRSLTKRHWWQRRRETQHVFDIPIPELCAARPEKASSVGRGTANHAQPLLTKKAITPTA